MIDQNVFAAASSAAQDATRLQYVDDDINAAVAALEMLAHGRDDLGLQVLLEGPLTRLRLALDSLREVVPQEAPFPP